MKRKHSLNIVFILSILSIPVKLLFFPLSCFFVPFVVKCISCIHLRGKHSLFQFSIFNFQFSIFNFQFSIFNFQFSITPPSMVNFVFPVEKYFIWCYTYSNGFFIIGILIFSTGKTAKFRDAMSRGGIWN